jgi:hypothetical protein
MVLQRWVPQIMRLAASGAIVAGVLFASRPTRAAAPPDAYADAVDGSTTGLVLNANNAVGAPDGQFATVVGALGQELVLDMGSGEEGTGALVVTYQGVIAPISATVEYLDSSYSVITTSVLNLSNTGVGNTFTRTVPYTPTVAATPYRYVRFDSTLNAYLIDAVAASTYRPDSDNDGLDDVDEATHSTDPLNPDSDGDGLPDGWEVDHGLDPNNDAGSNGATGDPDSDGLNNAGEYAHGTDPFDDDTDNDTLPDGWEVDNNLNPTDATGANGANGDPDHDQLNNTGEYQYSTDPHDSDTDNDDLPDGWEVSYGLNPLDNTGDDGFNGDPDHDGLSNGQEYALGTNPVIADHVLYFPLVLR